MGFNLKTPGYWIVPVSLALFHVLPWHEPPPRAVAAMVTGECRGLVVADKSEGAICQGVAANGFDQGGYSSFSFAAIGTHVIGFHGDDHHAQGNDSSLEVETISLDARRGTQAVTIPATGKCAYGDAYAGPAHIECHAVAAGKAYAAIFVTDGKAPSLQDVGRR